MNIPDPLIPKAEEHPSTSSYFIPGHARRKLLMILFGLGLLSFGLSQLWTPLRLLLFGTRTMAEATRVIKTKEGMPDLILTDDLQVKAKQETQDRSDVFWNEFAFQTLADNRRIVVRSPIGSQLKPLYPLIDEEGLPTVLNICYDPRHLDSVVFPTVFSTWFFPGAITLIGFICTIIGSYLFYWANKPIELPHIPGGAGVQR